VKNFPPSHLLLLNGRERSKLSHGHFFENWAGGHIPGWQLAEVDASFSKSLCLGAIAPCVNLEKEIQKKER
jgi:hypothetical protein